MKRRSSKGGCSQLCLLDVVVVALNQVSDGRKWYTSVMQLQLASLGLCIACRSVPTQILTVERGIPNSLLDNGYPSRPNQKRVCSTRVPRLRPYGVKWNLRGTEAPSIPIYALENGTVFASGDRFIGNVGRLGCVTRPHRRNTLPVEASSDCNTFGGIAWPSSLERLTFGPSFNGPLEGTVLPASLKRLKFGYSFDHSIEEIVFPPSLQKLTFGYHFNQPIARVILPASLRQLIFGLVFNQPIEGMHLPASLRELSFGRLFNQPIAALALPGSLQEVEFGDFFDQEIAAVTWPDSIKRLSFGAMFNRPVDGVTWPAELRTISFGNVNSGYPSRRILYVSSRFDQALDRARWPSSLKRLNVGGRFSQSLRGLRAWMPCLEELLLVPREASACKVLLREVDWPRGLRQLQLGRNVDLEGIFVPQTVDVKYG